MLRAFQNCPVEWTYRSDHPIDVLVTQPGGGTQTVPAFWSGEDAWRVRYASSQVGTHSYRIVGGNGNEGALEVAPYTGDNPLYRHGAMRVAADHRHFEHTDGTPFFWLADTWWMGLCQRLKFPGEFQQLVADRVRKGFNVIQIVAGLYPDMPSFDPRGANEAGDPWREDWSDINPAYWEQADTRIRALVENGLMPCIVGAWGYYLPLIGVEKMKQHWRNLVARYGAFPVTWCLAGEGAMPYYLSKDKDADRELQKRGWTEIARYVREIDPYRRPITIHPTDSARNQVEDPSLLDFDMHQTGHWDRGSAENTVRSIATAYDREPRMPVINGEVCYEGIGEACRQELQRFMFWVCVLNGAAGHTYGANGIWQLNRRGEPYGPSPHGMSWGHTPWDAAARLPGSEQVGLAKKFLQRFEWWRCEPHPEWVEPRATAGDYFLPYAAGIPGELRLIFQPIPTTHRFTLPTVKQIEPNVAYRAWLWNPVDGSEHPLGKVTPDAQGDWQPAGWMPVFQDWVMVLERETVGRADDSAPALPASGRGAPIPTPAPSAG